MKRFLHLTKIIESGKYSRIIFDDCKVIILSNYAVSFLNCLGDCIEKNLYKYNLNKDSAMKAFIYLKIKDISKNPDLSKFGIKEIIFNNI